jgi:hypothetical protein
LPHEAKSAIKTNLLEDFFRGENMKLPLLATMIAATLLVGCTKCQQQPTPETPPPASEATTPPPAEEMPPGPDAAPADQLPGSEDLNQEIPPEKK